MRKEDFARRFPMHLPRDRFIPNTMRTYGAAVLAKPDLAHGEFHLRQVQENCFILAITMGITRHRDLEILTAASMYHDLGYGFVSTNQLKADEHQIGSWLIATKCLEDLSYHRQVARTIKLHSRDVLPQKASLHSWIFQASDRVALGGWFGIIRRASYLGFTLSNPDVLRSLKHPWEKGFNQSEEVLERICLDQVLPFALDQGKVRELTGLREDLTRLFYGLPDRKGGWKIGPILPVAQQLFLPLLNQVTEFTKELLTQSLSQKLGDDFVAQLDNPQFRAVIKEFLGRYLPKFP